MDIEFQHLGWKSKIAKKRATYSISIKKVVVIGCYLEKGQELYSYLAKDNQERPLMITYLDGKPKYAPSKTDVTNI